MYLRPLWPLSNELLVLWSMVTMLSCRIWELQNVGVAFPGFCWQQPVLFWSVFRQGAKQCDMDMSSRVHKLFFLGQTTVVRCRGGTRGTIALWGWHVATYFWKEPSQGAVGDMKSARLKVTDFDMSSFSMMVSSCFDPLWPFWMGHSWLVACWLWWISFFQDDGPALGWWFGGVEDFKYFECDFPMNPVRSGL